MALVEQLGNDSKWYVQLAAIWHWYLPFYIYFIYILFLSIPFLDFLLNLVATNRTDWLTLPACPRFCVLL